MKMNNDTNMFVCYVQVEQMYRKPRIKHVARETRDPSRKLSELLGSDLDGASYELWLAYGPSRRTVWGPLDRAAPLARKYNGN